MFYRDAPLKPWVGCFGPSGVGSKFHYRNSVKIRLCFQFAENAPEQSTGEARGAVRKNRRRPLLPPGILPLRGIWAHKSSRTQCARVKPITVPGEEVLLVPKNGNLETKTLWRISKYLAFWAGSDSILYFPQSDKKSVRIVHKFCSGKELVTTPRSLAIASSKSSTDFGNPDKRKISSRESSLAALRAS